MIPVIFRTFHLQRARGRGESPKPKRRIAIARRETAAVIGVVAAIGALGGYFIPRASARRSRPPAARALAITCFIAFYLTCVRHDLVVLPAPLVPDRAHAEPGQRGSLRASQPFRGDGNVDQEHLREHRRTAAVGRRRQRHGRAPLRRRPPPSADCSPRFSRVVVSRRAAARLRPRQPLEVVRRQERRRAVARRRRRIRGASASRSCAATRSRSLDRDAQTVRIASGASSPTTSWCSRPARIRSCRRSRAAISRAASCIARSTISRRSERRGAGARRGAVIGGGLLGLEAANALLSLGLETHVDRVRAAPDAAAGRRRRRRACCARASRSSACACTPARRRARSSPATTAASRAALRRRRRAPDRHGGVLAGIRPRDELARGLRAGLGERGGIVIDDACRTSDPRHLRDRRVRAVRRQDLRPGRARLPHGGGRRGRRSPARRLDASTAST